MGVLGGIESRRSSPKSAAVGARARERERRAGEREGGEREEVGAVRREGRQREEVGVNDFLCTRKKRDSPTSLPSASTW